MIVGADVNHSTQSGKKANSCVGFAATMDSLFSKYYTQVAFQSTGQEIMDTIVKFITNALLAFKQHNHCFPDVVLFYRDGVGEGQFGQVLEYEISQV
jgi:aubergine-like protein